MTNRKLDEIIGEKNNEDLKLMEKEASRFQRLVVSFEKSTDFPELPPSKRSLKPVQVFSELQSMVENFYPGFSAVLVKPGTQEIIGSQDELLFAYQDALEGKVLNLELNLYKQSSKKRKHPAESDFVAPTFRHEGPWSNGEIELFKMGVDQFGWKKWKNIAGVVGTRDREQVRQFASTPKGIKIAFILGLRFKKTLSITPGLLDLAEGMKIVAQSFQDQGGQSVGDDQLE